MNENKCEDLVVEFPIRIDGVEVGRLTYDYRDDIATSTIYEDLIRENYPDNIVIDYGIIHKRGAAV